MNPNEINIFSQNFIGVLATTQSSSFAIMGNQSIKTNSPILSEIIFRSNCSTESTILYNFTNFYNDGKHVSSLSTPVFEPDAKKSASKSIS